MKKPNTAMTDNAISSAEKRALQVEYARAKNFPMFAPPNCFNCGANYWDRISKEKAEKTLVTNCPYCNHSFCS